MQDVNLPNINLEDIDVESAELEHRRRSCVGKVRHPNRDRAEREARRLRSLGADVLAYECRYCGGGYHVGHVPGAKG